MSLEEINAFRKLLGEITATLDKGRSLSEFPKEIADAVKALIASAVRREREACAAIADDAAEGSGTISRGQVTESNPLQRQTAREIAEFIRRRSQHS